jgi:hypothetical protein
LTRIRSAGYSPRCFDWRRKALRNGGGGKHAGRVLGGREKSIIAMRLTVENTVTNSYGQLVQRMVKNKELRMTSADPEKLIASLLDLQDESDGSSNGHYEAGNLQVRVSVRQLLEGRHRQRGVPLATDAGETRGGGGVTFNNLDRLERERRASKQSHPDHHAA